MPSKRLYYDEPYLSEFKATVISCEPCDRGYRVILDQTAFYPTSGGQPNDLGSIGAARVIDVVEEADETVHIVDSPLSLNTITAALDWNRRFDFMQQHAGQHILSAAFEKVVDADTIGFHLTEHSLTIDLNVVELSREAIEKVEYLSNEAVFADKRILLTWPSETELAKLPLRKPPARSTGIRVVVIDGFDYSPCGGTHPLTTGQVGLIKIVSWEKVRGGVRVEFVCGRRALADYREKNYSIASISAALSIPGTEATAAVKRLVEQAVANQKRIESMNKELLTNEAALLGSSGTLITRYYGFKEMSDLRLLAAMISAQGGRVAILGAAEPAPQVIVSRSDDLPAIDARIPIEAAKAVLGGKGGGNPKQAQAGGPDKTLVEAAVRAAEEEIRKVLSL